MRKNENNVIQRSNKQMISVTLCIYTIQHIRYQSVLKHKFSDLFLAWA